MTAFALGVRARSTYRGEVSKQVSLPEGESGSQLLHRVVSDAATTFAESLQGLKFPVDDAEALAAHMSWVIDNPEQIRSLGDAARRRALEVFSKEEMMHRHLQLYGQFVHAAGAAHE